MTCLIRENKESYVVTGCHSGAVLLWSLENTEILKMYEYWI